MNCFHLLQLFMKDCDLKRTTFNFDIYNDYLRTLKLLLDSPLIIIIIIIISRRIIM